MALVGAASWRGYAAMDPRCYFSSTWWRKAKQSSIDALKQNFRLKLLERRPGRPLMDLETLAAHQTELFKRLRELDARVVVLGCCRWTSRVSRFSGTFRSGKCDDLGRLLRLRELSSSTGGRCLPANGTRLFYRDGFHPNAAGAAARERSFWDD